MGLGGVSAAVAQERHDVDGARAAVMRADRDFHRHLQKALDEGTPSKPLEPLARVEYLTWSAGHERSFVIDRILLEDLKARVLAVTSLTGTVDETERGVELDLSAQLATAMTDLKQDLAAAHTAGVPDVADYDSRGDAYAGWIHALVVPKEMVARLQQVSGLALKVRDATSAKLASDMAAADAARAAADAAAAAAAALQAARDNAAYQHDRAHGDLAQAQAIVVLRVADIAATIASIDNRQPQPQSIPDLNQQAADYAYQARLLENILIVRSNTYGQLARARSLAGRAAGVGADVSSYVARLNAANGQLDGAPDIASILAVADIIRDVSNGLNGAYSYAVAHPPPPPGAIILNVPYYAQVYSLSCEEAALQMALAYEGIHKNQDEILNDIGVDRRAPEVDRNGNVVHWGNPMTNFVGDPNGYREGAQYGSRSGYGTYYPTIARAATDFGGHVFAANQGLSPGWLYDQIANHRPSVVWVAWQYSPHPTTTYVAWDGQTVLYGAPWEHAVTLIGTSGGSVLIANPHGGQEWISKPVFERAYAMFGDMAVTLTS
jgi:uncharacterized protein YvpB